ncbi:MAG: DUF4190 domain-containing protein [Lachnospiraceae bacterium]|nr:DUF4190 domain-containing protein [Lachnospiraceae bacterium]
MARYIQDAGINQPLDVVSEAMEQYLYRNRYIRTEWKDELVYMSADGDAKGNRYLIWSYMSGILHIEAWLKGSFGNEVGLTGSGSKKRAYKESIDKLIETLRHPIKDEYTRSEDIYQSQKPVQSYMPPTQSSVPPYAQQKEQPYTPPHATQPKEAAGQDSSQQSRNSSTTTYTESWMGGKQGTQRTTWNPSGSTQPNTSAPWEPDYREEKNQKAAKGLTFGIVALITSFIISIVGLIVGIMGLSYCREGMDSDMADKARIGKVLCNVAIVWCFMRLLYYFILGVSMLAAF